MQTLAGRISGNRALPVLIALLSFPLWILGISLIVVRQEALISVVLIGMFSLLAFFVIVSRPALGVPVVILANGTFALSFVAGLGGTFSNLTLADPVIFILLVGTLFQRRDTRNKFLSPLAFTVYFYVTYTIFSTFIAPLKILAIPRVVQTIEFAFLPSIVSTFVRTRKDFRRILVAMVWVAIGTSIYAIYSQFFVAGLAKDIGIYNGNSYGFFFDITLPMLIGIYLSSGRTLQNEEMQNFWLRPNTLLAVIVLTGFADLVGFSRGSYLGIIVGMVVLAFITRDALLLRVLPLLAIIAVAVVIILPESTIQSVSSDTTLSIRELSWSLAQQIFLQHPFTGIGIGNILYGEQLTDFKNGFFLDPHNFFWRTAAEMGIIGLVIVGLIFLVVIVRLLRNVTLTRQGNEPFYFALNAGMAGGLVAYIVHTYYDVFWVRGGGTLWWIVAGLVFAIPGVLQRIQRKEDTTA